MALSQPHPAFIAHQVAMVEGGERQTERAEQQDLAGGGLQQVGAAHHLGDLHGSVIHHHGKLISGDVVAPPNHEIAEILAGHEPLLALPQVGERDHFPIRDPEAPMHAFGLGMGPRFRNPRPAAPGIERLVILSLGRGGSLEAAYRSAQKDAGSGEWRDPASGRWYVAGKDFGDFVIWRRDDIPAYQLAVVVDDAAMRITEVVRGADLLKSTARQILLARALGLPIPAFYHCDLLRDENGVRLAKRHDALSLRALREAGISPAEIRLAWNDAAAVAALAERVSPPPQRRP